MKVYAAICAITAELSRQGISKDHKNQQQGYAFRGIDDVYAAVSPLLAKHMLCILPRVVSHECIERQTAKGGMLFYTIVRMEFDFVSAEDDSKHTVAMIGEAMDSGDKSSNKAQSAAYKYACFQTFAIPTEGDNDADAHTHQVVAKSFRSSPTMGELDGLPAEEQIYIRDLAMEVLAIAKENPSSAVALIEAEKLDDSQKMGLWGLLDSKTRSAIKKAQQPKEVAA